MPDKTEGDVELAKSITALNVSSNNKSAEIEEEDITQ